MSEDNTGNILADFELFMNDDQSPAGKRSRQKQVTGNSSQYNSLQEQVRL